MRIEMHVHTKYSKDSLLCFGLLYVKCLLSGINYIAITEHNNIDGGLKFKEFCKKHGDRVKVIVGEEIFTSKGEIIGLYLEKGITPNQTPQKTIDEIIEQGGVVYIPHPFDLKRQKTVLVEKEIAVYKKRIDCIEIHNGRNLHDSDDLKQKEIADKYRILPVIGSDAHTWFEVGRNYMYCEDMDLSTSQSFRDAISSFKFHPQKCIRIAHYVTKVVKGLKLLGRGRFDEFYRIIIRKSKKSLW